MIPSTITIKDKITRKDLEKEGFKVGEYASDMLKNLTWTKGTHDLVVKTVAELGLSNGGTLSEIYAKAKEQGLELCPPEIGPALRKEYNAQPNGEWLRIAMEPITVSDDYLGVFNVGHDGGDRWLGSYYGRPDYVWYPGGRWVFVVPRKSLSTQTSDSLSGTETLSTMTHPTAKEVENWQDTLAIILVKHGCRSFDGFMEIKDLIHSLLVPKEAPKKIERLEAAHTEIGPSGSYVTYHPTGQELVDKINEIIAHLTSKE